MSRKLLTAALTWFVIRQQTEKRQDSMLNQKTATPFSDVLNYCLTFQKMIMHCHNHKTFDEKINA